MQPARTQGLYTIWCKRFSCRIPKATNPHSECAILISFPLQQRLHECASILRYAYDACIVTYFLHLHYSFQTVLLFQIFSSKKRASVFVCHREPGNIDAITTTSAICCYFITVTVVWPEGLVFLFDSYRFATVGSSTYVNRCSQRDTRKRSSRGIRQPGSEIKGS